MKKIILLILLGLMFSCHQTKNHLNSRPHYEEDVSHIFLTEDKSSLVVLTTKYHYIFDAPEGLASILNKEYSKHLWARFSAFHLNADNNIRGEIYVNLNLRYVDKDNAYQDGFDLSRVGVSKKLVLNGVRYLAGQSFSNLNERSFSGYKLNRKYRITVRIPKTSEFEMQKALKTPLVLAEDMIKLPKQVVGAVGMTAIFTVCAVKMGCR